MLRPTHQAISVTSSVGASIAMSVPLSGAVAIVVVARQAAMLPDKMEKIFGVKMTNHRTWTHWLLTCFLTGAVLGLMVYGLGYLVEYLMRERLTGSHAHEVLRTIHTASIGGGVIVWIGSTIGTVTHSLADACTLSGVPLFGPFTKKKFWLMPDGLRTRTGDLAKAMKGERMIMTAGEKRWFILAHFMTIFILFLHFAPYMHLDKIQS